MTVEQLTILLDKYPITTYHKSNLPQRPICNGGQPKCNLHVNYLCLTLTTQQQLTTMADLQQKET